MAKKKAELIKIAKAEMAKYKQSHGCQYGLIWDGGQVWTANYSICYGVFAGPNRVPTYPGSEIKYMWDWEFTGCSQIWLKDALSYINWWVNESVVKDIFITKDPEEIIKDGAILDCNYPGQLVITAATGLRYVREFPDLVRAWLHFNENLSPEASIILAHFLRKDSRGKWSSNKGNTNHLWLGADSAATVSRVLTKNPRTDGLDKFKNTLTYRGMFQMWSDGEHSWRMPVSPKATVKTTFGTTINNGNSWEWREEDVPFFVEEFIRLNWPKGDTDDEGVH